MFSLGGASVSYPLPRYKLQRRPTEVRAQGFNDWPHHFDSEYYKLSPHVVYDSENTQDFISAFHVLRIFDTLGDLR